MNPGDFRSSHQGGTDQSDKDAIGPTLEGGGAWATTPHKARAGHTGTKIRACGSVGQRETGHKFTGLCAHCPSFLAGSECSYPE